MTFGLVKGSSPTDNLYYGVSIQSTLPSLHLVLRSQTEAKAVWPRETSFKEELKTVVRELLTCTQPNRRKYMDFRAQFALLLWKCIIEMSSWECRLRCAIAVEACHRQAASAIFFKCEHSIATYIQYTIHIKTKHIHLQ